MSGFFFFFLDYLQDFTNYGKNIYENKTSLLQGTTFELQKNFKDFLIVLSAGFFFFFDQKINSLLSTCLQYGKTCTYSFSSTKLQNENCLL